MTGIGDIEETVREVAQLSRSLERQVLTNFSARDLTESDFAWVTASSLGGPTFAARFSIAPSSRIPTSRPRTSAKRLSRPGLELSGVTVI